MSDATKAALDAAIHDHFADAWDDEGGCIVTGYVLQVTGQTIRDMDVSGGRSSYMRAIAENQHPAMSVGLATYLSAACEAALLPDFDEDDDDD